MADFEGSGKFDSVNRMHARHAMLVDAHRHVISDANVLQLGAGDGRWCFAFAAAGALQVVGIEEDAKLVERFSVYPDVGMRERIELRCANPIKELVAEIAAKRRYEVVALFDLLTDVADLYHLFDLIKQLNPHMIILDGLFVISDAPILELVSSDTPDGALDGKRRPRAVPSHCALDIIADALEFELEWIDWNAVPEGGRSGVPDYYTTKGQKRASCTMVPRALLE